MNAQIIKFDKTKEFFHDERCFIIELLNSSLDEMVSIAHVRVPVGVKTKRHKLINTTERYVILQGIGLMYLDDLEPEEIQQGDIVFIPPEHTQSIQNIGDIDLVFLAICSPRFKNDVYVDMEG